MLHIIHNGTTCVLRPVPLISITQNTIRNKAGLLGSYYDITLTGTILPNEGSPYFVIGGGASLSGPNTPVASFKQDNTRPSTEKNVGLGHSMASIIVKQNLIRELFKRDGQRFELWPASVSPEIGNDGGLAESAIIKFYPTVQSINFEEGLYVSSCKYTVNLRAELIFDSADNIISDGLINSTYFPSGTADIGSKKAYQEDTRETVQQQLNKHGGFIEDYSENWSIEAEEGRGITNTKTALTANQKLPNDHIASIRSYKLTRTINATGRTVYYSEGSTNKRLEAWEQARDYIHKTVLRDKNGSNSDDSTGYEQFPEYTMGPYFGSGFLNIARDVFGGYNHLRTESIDTTAGSCSITDVWLICSGTAFEDYRMSIGKSADNGLHKVTIDGTIKGLSSAPAGHKWYGGSITGVPVGLGNGAGNPINSQYQNALYKFHQVSNTGQYGPQCFLYKRASQAVHLPLNHVPLSISIGSNEFAGEITYSIDYDTRPLNLVSGTLSESITCSDTYPGDLFAVVPVIGRQTGPVLQYIGGRTEYQRSLNIELVMDRYYDSGNHTLLRDRIRAFSVLSKPSLNQPFRSQIKDIIDAYSPARENGIRKYFVSPPTETWDASSGRYSLNINWTYEVNR